MVAYLICVIEFCERASYYGVQPLISNFVNKPLPAEGNGYGAPARGTQTTAGALGMGPVAANAISQSFQMLIYVLPMFWGWLADSKTGRFKLICYGVAVFGISHVIMTASGAKSLLATGASKGPYFLSLYMLAVGGGEYHLFQRLLYARAYADNDCIAMFKPLVSPLLLDQIPTTVPTVTTNKKGEKVIVDPESTTERVMLWFYLMINIGGFMAVATSYSEKYVGWWLAFLIPLMFYLPLPLLLWWLKKRIILHPPGGSDLGKVFRIIGICFRNGGLKKIGRHGFWNAAKPSVLAAKGQNADVPWDDQFVEDVRRAFQATGIFCFFPIQYLNDNGIGNAVNYTTTMLTTNGVPNDVLYNFNSLSIILFAPILNYGLYPLLRRWKIHYGPVARITTGLALSTIGGLGYTLLNNAGYKKSPCGEFATSLSCVDTDGNAIVAPITVWWVALPYALGGVSELFINVPAYGIAYSRAPPNMRGLVSAINLLSTGVAYAIGLACSSVIQDPYLTWDLGGVAIAGGILTVVFWFMFKHIDKEEYTLSQNGDHHVTAQGRDPSMDGHTTFNPPTTVPAQVLELEKKGEHVPTTIEA